jgi:hypothetical protein
MLSSRARGRRARRELVLLLLCCLLHLDLLLFGDFGRWGDLGCEAVEDDFGLFEVATGV